MNQPQPPPQPKLKLKIGGLPNASITGAMTPSTTTPAGSPPPQTPGGSSTRIKLVARRPSGMTPATTPAPSDAGASFSMPPPAAPPTGAGAAAPKAAKAPKAPKVKIPKPTKTSPKKRPKPTDDDDDDDVPLANGTSKEPAKKKPKIMILKTPKGPPPKGPPKKPVLKVKYVGKTPYRPPGAAYDSEAEDRELDPQIEEQFLLRMMEGEHLNYLREQVQNKNIGTPKSQGGPDFSLKFIDEQGRRAVLSIQGQLYAAVLLDLPTITEGMKSWDKKAMVKSADICQMMLVFAKVNDEEEAKTVPLPKAVEHGHRWPHGITPPMHDARKRRFRKRLSKLEIQNKEAEVERLLALDREAISTNFEFIDEQPALPNDEESGDEYEEEDEDADAEGEIEDYFGDAEADQEVQDQEDEDAALEAEMMDMFNEEDEEEPAEPTDQATPAVGGTDAVTPATANTGTPMAPTDDSGTEAAAAVDAAAAAAEQEESLDDDEDDDEDADDDDMDGDGDEDRHDEVAGVRNQIASLKKQLADYEEQLSKMTSNIMKKRIEASIKNIKSEIKLKQSAIGEEDDD
ncbi:transcription initiation factor TFIID subunit 7 [Rhypophila decipiens]|uniref:Transcription initiation factor TFIID subunit 7 n=1 Tax=Rhypophila decipiens TaxID=261697 RepID=A0AAN6Y2A1_9PEZI|nr:transcription initiation factor TFIID subunit 7 [Rhypophila decipiens]